MSSEPTLKSATELFTHLQSLYPSITVPHSGWYLVVLSVPTSIGHCHLVGDLYTYLVSLPEYSTTAERQALMQRLHEDLVKLSSIISIPQPIDVLTHLNARVSPSDHDYSFSRAGWTNDAANRARGEAWLRTLYGPQFESTFTVFDAHKDMGWLSTEITYGLCLSDHRILGGVETQVCVLSGLMCQGLPRMVGWHLRGMRRIGVSGEDCERVQRCVEVVAEFLEVGGLGGWRGCLGWWMLRVRWVRWGVRIRVEREAKRRDVGELQIGSILV